MRPTKRALYEPLFAIIPLIRDLGKVLLGRVPGADPSLPWPARDERTGTRD
jgi:hypothetical protein